MLQFSTYGDPMVYWGLRLLLLIILAVCGYKVSFRNDKPEKYWKIVSPGIIAYTLIQGLRYMRGKDYGGYMDAFMTGEVGQLAHREWIDPIWESFLKVFHLSGFHFSIGFVLCSFLLIYSFAKVVKFFPKTAVWAFPLFVLMTGSSENIVRQFVADSFILLAFCEFLQSNKKRVYIYCLLGLGIHFSALFVVFLLLLFGYVKRFNLQHIKTPILFTLIYVLIYFLWSASFFEYFAGFLSSLSVDDDMAGAHYLEEAEEWFTSSGSISTVLGANERTVSIVYNSVFFLCNLSIVWFGWYALKKDPRLLVVYWFAYLAIILDVISGDIQIYRRFYNWLVCMVPIMYGAIIDEDIIRKKELRYATVAIFLMAHLFYGFFRDFGTMGMFGCGFIWDM